MVASLETWVSAVIGVDSVVAVAVVVVDTTEFVSYYHTLYLLFVDRVKL